MYKGEDGIIALVGIMITRSINYKMRNSNNYL